MGNVLKGVMSCILFLNGLTMEANTQELNKGFTENFTSASSTDWHIAEYDFTHPHFDTDWRKAQAIFGDPLDTLTRNGLILRLSPAVKRTPSKNKFIGGSIRRQAASGYGRYESWIQPTLGVGAIAGFFTYSGPAYGTQHDEIDVEFLGKNTNQLHIAWFVNGVLTNKFIDLGFNASEKSHHYAFDWLPKKILWYVDGKLVFEISQADSPLPTPPGRLFANIWAADSSIQKWAGLAKPTLTGSAYFSQMSFTPYTNLPNPTVRDAATTIVTKESEPRPFHE